MRHAHWALLGAVALAVALVARTPGIAPPLGQPPAVSLLLVIEEGGQVTPAVSTVRYGSSLGLSVLNRSTRPVRFELTGYEERVATLRIAPDSTFRVRFVADRPGDEFEWLVDGRAAGRFIVLGSRLDVRGR